jgi:hypothetical protein
MKRQRRQIEVFNLSFLDVVSCGFGAIILLLVISLVSEPRVIEKMSVDLSGLLMRLEKELYEIRGETQILNRNLTAKQRQLSESEENITLLLGDLSRIRGQFHTAKTDSDAQTLIENELQTARQQLTEEMRRLQSISFQPPKTDAVIGGVPVDSEYIIFIIDTSGSMQRYAWPLVRRKMQEILAIYPRVKGIQVMNDMGDYMFSQYAGRWIPDSPAASMPRTKKSASMCSGTTFREDPFRRLSTRWTGSTGRCAAADAGYASMRSASPCCSPSPRQR